MLLSSLLPVIPEPEPCFPFSSAGAEQKTRALTHIFQGTLGQLWLQMCARDGSHWTRCARHMEAIRSHLGYKGHDALCCSSQILTAVSGVWCCSLLGCQSPGAQVGTADGAQHEPPNWPLLLDWAGPWEVLRIPLNPRKNRDLAHLSQLGGSSLCLGSVMSSLKLCAWSSHMQGDPLHHPGGRWWSCISMVIFSFFWKVFPTWEQQSWAGDTTHLICFTFDLAVGQWSVVPQAVCVLQVKMPGSRIV